MTALKKIILRELEYVIKTRDRRILLFVVPLIVYFFIPFIYSNRAVHNIPVAVFDEDNTELTRALTRFVHSSATLDVVYRVASYDEIEKLILQDEIKAAFYFPRGMTSAIKRGGNATANVLINSQNIVFGNLIYKAASEILVTVSSGIMLKKLGADGLPLKSGINLVMPFRLQARALYNPSYDYMQYLAPGLLTVLFQMIIMFAAASSINREFASGKGSSAGINRLLEISGNGVAEIILGKTLSYVVLSVFPAALILFAVFPVMGIVVFGNLAVLFVYFLYFAFVSAAMGILFSSFFLDKVLALDIVFFYNSPAFVFSGFTFPVWALPAYDKFYAQLIPYTHFITGFLQLYQMDVPAEFAIPSILKLSVFLVVGLAGGTAALKFHLNRLNLVSNAETV